MKQKMIAPVVLLPLFGLQFIFPNTVIVFRVRIFVLLFMSMKIYSIKPVKI